MVSENVSADRIRFRLATVVKAAYAPDAYRETIERRAAAYERAYPLLVRRGIGALMLLPPALLALACVVEEKLPLIAALVIALVGIYAFLIVVEYLHERVAHKLRLCELSSEELAEVLNESLREEVLATAPIDSLLEMAGRERPHERVAHRIREHMDEMRAGRTPTDTEDESVEEDVEQNGDDAQGGDLR
jgi:hypothetical protein